MAMSRRVGLVALLSLLLIACSQVGNSPPRPANVPADAIWIGGPDGGVFAKLSPRPDASPGEVAAQIFSQTTGESIFRGRLRIQPVDSPLPGLNDPEVFTAWDGEKLLMTDGRTLVPAPASAK
jgi:hypothetical protein